MDAVPIARCCVRGRLTARPSVPCWRGIEDPGTQGRQSALEIGTKLATSRLRAAAQREDALSPPESDPREAMNVAFELAPSVKGVVVVDEDVDVENLEEIEWAVATRFQPDRDLVVISNVPGFTLDPSTRKGMTSKWGIDATKPLDALERFERVKVPEEVSARVKQILGI